MLVTHMWNQGEGGVSDPAGTRRKEVLVVTQLEPMEVLLINSWNQEEGGASDPYQLLPVDEDGTVPVN